MLSLQTPQAGLAVVDQPGQDEQFVTSTRIPNNAHVFYVSANEEHIKATSTKSNNIGRTLIRQKLKNNEVCEDWTYPSILENLKTIPLENQ